MTLQITEGGVAKTCRDVNKSWTFSDSKINSPVANTPEPLTTKVTLFDTLMARVGRLEAEVCYYRMEVEERGSPLGRLRTMQAYFERMEKSWGVHRNLARKLLEDVLESKGMSDRTVLRLMPPEIKDPIKRENRLGKTRKTEQYHAVAGEILPEGGVASCYQEPE